MHSKREGSCNPGSLVFSGDVVAQTKPCLTSLNTFTSPGDPEERSSEHSVLAGHPL